MKITAIIVLSGYLICASSDAQYPWTNDSFHKSMCGKAACEELVIETVAGKIQGRAFESVLNKAEYYAFLGIPYAKPPVGYLRFQVSQPVDHWHGIYPAYYEKSICPQIYFVTELIGMSAEDCLYLNVYVPQIPRKIVSLKPVIVTIHGGAFIALSGSKLFYSPDYLITKDVVVVSINYRLGVLGFLNLGIPECAGNMGLKDQVMALKWIQQNIARFGGDPKNVMISGESAGGASVHFHLLSPMSRGLFHKAIVRSGTSLSPWALTYNPIVRAFEIGELCGYRGKDRYKLLTHLKTKSLSYISAAAAQWFFHYRQVYPARPLIIGPSVEMHTKGAFLPDFPSNLIKSAIPVPTIFGFDNKEGVFIIIDIDNQSVEKVSRSFSLLVTDNFPVYPKSVAEVSLKIKQQYFGNKRVGLKTANELIDLYSDIFNYYAYDSMQFLINSSTPPFVYCFAYPGNLNFFMKTVNTLKGTKLNGAAHADDHFYVYYPSVLSNLMHIDSESRRIIDLMATTWTDFAKTGNPSGFVEWKASTSKHPRYLLIDRNSKMMSGKFHGWKFDFLKNTLDSVIKPGTRPYDIF